MFNHVFSLRYPGGRAGVLGIFIVSRNQTGKKETQRKLIVLLIQILSSVKKRLKKKKSQELLSGFWNWLPVFE